MVLDLPSTGGHFRANCADRPRFDSFPNFHRAPFGERKPVAETIDHICRRRLRCGGGHFGIWDKQYTGYRKILGQVLNLSRTRVEL